MITLTPKHTFRIIFAFAFVVLAAGVAAYLFFNNTSEEGIKIKRVEEPLSEEGQPVLGLAANENDAVFESRVFEARMRFNAIALYWKEKNISPNKLDRRVFIRTSLNGEDWGDWLEIESLGPMRDSEPDSEFTFPEVPILIDGKFFQYQVVIRGSAGRPSPVLSDFHVSYIDSRTPPLKKLIGDIKNFLSSFSVQAANEGPTIIPRASWGSPDPYGNLFKGTTRYWDPAYYPVKQIFVHHTVFRNESDPAAAIRAIWEYHTYTRGWGDIGYNYLIDQQGRVYEGRFGGDNVEAGHVYKFNRGSLGVALLGCFQNNNSACTGAPPPSPAMVNSLTTFLAWKSTNYEINPNTTQTFCGSSSCLNLWTIAGHRDASATACPGNLIYDQLSSIRSQTAGKLGNWGYSAKQADLSPADLTAYGADQSVTIGFKNTGTATWSNNGSTRLLLKTANPNGRTSAFRGSGWIDSQTPAALNEATVAPGETGTFTFNFKTDLPTDRRDSPESFRLVLEDGSEISQMFTVIARPPVDTLADVAAFYDYGNCETRIHAFNSTGNNLSYKGDTGWWSSTDYCASKIIHAVSGDFDGDGLSDIAILYEPTIGESRIHVWLSDGDSLNFQGMGGWWVGTRYTASRIRQLLAGDFNNDGKDDLAAFYDYGSRHTRIHVWRSTGSSFAWPGTWWEGTAYNSNQTSGVSAGYFNGDNYADIAAFYYYGNRRTRIHVWRSTGSSFAWPGTWWEGTAYDLTRTTNIPSSNFNLDERSSLAMFYYYGNSKSRIHVWRSTGSSFAPEVWWEGNSYNSLNVPFAVSGFYSPVYENRRGDFISIYNFGDNGVRMHGFLSTGSSFRPSVWWESSRYKAANIIKVVSGHFGK